MAGGVGVMSMDYLGGFQYQGTALKFFPTAEGYVQATALKVGFAYSYVYNYTDHLGNIRLSYAQDPENPNVLKIIEESHYYPFGLKHTNYNSDQLAFKEKDPGPGIMLAAAAAGDPVPQFMYNYKYNGKEFQDEMSLNWYDYGARNYDPAIGRWMNIDLLAEKHANNNPYMYVNNNPVIFIDPDGMDFTLTGKEAQDFVKNLQSQMSANNSQNDNDDTYTVDKNGNIMYSDSKKYYDKNGKEVDRLIALDDKGLKTKKTIDVAKGTLDGEKEKTSTGKKYSYYFSTNIENMKLLFNFLSLNTYVEWALVSDTKNSWLTTNNSRDTEAGGVALLINFLQENNYTKYTHTHNHPSGSTTPSGTDGRDNKNGGNDTKVKKYFQKYFPGRVTFYIYAGGKTVNY